MKTFRFLNRFKIRQQKLTLLIVLTVTSFVARAQSTVLDTTHRWTSVQNIDLYSAQTLLDTFLITVSSTSFTLKNENVEKEFPIENIQGSWVLLSEAGQLTFDIPLPGFTGKGSVQQEAGTLSLIVDFSERKDWMKRKFIIQN